MADKKNLLLLFDHPLEPVFMKKGRENAVFETPSNYLPERFQHIDPNALLMQFSETAGKRISVRDHNITSIIPDLKVPLSYPRNAEFSIQVPHHRRAASHLINIFMDLPTIDDLQSVAVYARDRLNPILFSYALSVALLHRPDTKDLNVPPFVELFPDKFMDSNVFAQILEQATVVPESQRRPVIVPKDFTASDIDPEHRLWYFREDIGVNLHHWHWHLVYPFEAGTKDIVKKDRRGELFFYMHNQLVARYNFERFSNNLPRTKAYGDLHEPIQEPYFPKMVSSVASRGWPARGPNTTLSDLDRKLDSVKCSIADLECWRDRFLEACHQGYVIDTAGNKVMLDESRGIDILGNLLEASVISMNRDLYGEFHNMGHIVMAYAHDPDQRYLEPYGVMADLAVQMRDPVFYRWHTHLDDLFQVHKEKLPPYTTQQLDFSGVVVGKVQVQPEQTEKQTPTDTFQTFWQQTDIDVSRGLNFVPHGKLFVRFTHLQHQKFTYNITIDNNTGQPVKGTCRIFMSPTCDERGTEILFRDRRKLVIEMDKFVVTLDPGQNSIRRYSTESSVTIPFERTFRKWDPDVPEDQDAILDFCNCGWPQHMLIPKGLPGQGLQCDLFVMVSDYRDDQVQEELGCVCSQASSFCGLRDRLYPDRRAMGFPFDRLPRQGADSLQQFLTPNMNVTTVRIVHNDETTVNPNNPQKEAIDIAMQEIKLTS